MKFEDFLNLPLKEKLNKLTKEEIIEIVLYESEAFIGYENNFNDAANDIYMRNKKSKREKLLHDSEIAGNKYTSLVNSCNSFKNKMLKDYNVPIVDGKFKYSDLYKNVPANILNEWENKLQELKDAKDKYLEIENEFMKEIE